MLACAFLMLTPQAHAHDEDATREATIIRSDKPGEQIKDLKWDNDSIDLQRAYTPKGPAFVAKLHGRLTKSGSTLISSRQRVPLTNAESENQTFTVSVPVQGRRTSVYLYSISPYGQVEKEKATIYFPDWEKWVSLYKYPLKRYSLSIGVGYTVLDYIENRTYDPVYTAGVLAGGQVLPASSISFVQTGITPKISYNYQLAPPRWDIGANAYMTALTLSNTGGPDYTARFLGLNLRIGYNIPGISDPWSLSVSGGVFYSSMLVSSTDQNALSSTFGSPLFGYTSIIYPQALPMLRYRKRNGDAVYGYMKFVPVNQSVSQIFDFTHREIAFGMGYEISNRNRTAWILSLDAADLAVSTLDSNNTTFEFDVKSLTLGLGYRW